MIIPMTSSYRFERRTTNKMKKGIKTITAMLLEGKGYAVSLCWLRRIERTSFRAGRKPPSITTACPSRISKRQAKEEGEVASVGMPTPGPTGSKPDRDHRHLAALSIPTWICPALKRSPCSKKKAKRGTKDIGDVGQQWGPVAAEEGRHPSNTRPATGTQHS